VCLVWVPRRSAAAPEALCIKPLGRNRQILHEKDDDPCHGSHFWARELTSLGHTVRLLPAQYVKPFLVGGKNDANDAAAICAAVARSGIHIVAIKSAEQQSLQSVHRMRQRLIQERTAKSNQIRSMFAEEGVIFPVGLPQLRKGVVALQLVAGFSRLLNLPEVLCGYDFRRFPPDPLEFPIFGGR